MSKILVKSNGFGGVSYMIDPRQRGGPTIMDLGRRVFDSNLRGGQRLGALAGLAGKIGAGAVAANQAAYGLQAGNLSAPFGAMDQYAALDPTRGMKLTDAENKKRLQEQAHEQVALESMKRDAERQAQIAAQPTAGYVPQIDLPTIDGTYATANQTANRVAVPPTNIAQPNMLPAAQNTQVQNMQGQPTLGSYVQTPMNPPTPLPTMAQVAAGAVGTTGNAQDMGKHANTIHQSSASPEATEEQKLLADLAHQVVNNPQNPIKNSSYVDMAFNEMGDLFYKQSAEDVAKAITFAFLKYRR